MLVLTAVGLVNVGWLALLEKDVTQSLHAVRWYAQGKVGISTVGYCGVSNFTAKISNPHSFLGNSSSTGE